jgi:Domain of unknown function (DUF4340)
MNALLADPRRRNLAILGAIAVVSVLLAALALWRQSAEVAQRYKAEEYFPGLAAHVAAHEVQRIHVVHKGKAFDVVFQPSKTWVLPGKNDYPASQAEVNGMLAGLAALETIEPKTARPDWFKSVDLDDPAKGGNGTEITLSDERGKVLARVILGKTEDVGDQSGLTGLFVRRPDEDQSWLVGARFQPHGQESDWIEKSVLDIDQASVQEVDVDPQGSPSYIVRRDKPSDANLQLVSLPSGRELSSPSAPGALAGAMASLAVEDAKPAKDVDFTNASRFVAKTFDGLSVTAEIVHVGQDYWAQFSAADTDNKPDVAKKAREIDARASGWAFKLSDDKGAAFTSTLESLLKPKGGPEAQPGLPTGPVPTP